MSMKLPQEIDVWYIIPAIRREFAKGLLKKGLKQREIAKKLSHRCGCFSVFQL